MSNKAFTLIELLVVIGVISIFSGMSMAFYNKFNDQKSLESDAKKFQSVFELTKQKSLVDDKSPCSDISAPLQPYSLNFYNNVTPNYYTIANTCASPSEIARYKLGSNDSFLSAGSIQFKLSEPGIIGGTQTIKIQNSNINKCEVITIDISSSITVSSITACS